MLACVFPIKNHCSTASLVVVNELSVIALLSFSLSLVFALGGVGSALILVPALMGLGIPGSVARPIGLLVNTASLGGGSLYNLKTGKFKPRSWWLLIAFSLPAAPAGAWLSTLVPQETLLGFFACFMIFSSFLMVRPARQKKERTDDSCPLGTGALLGTVSGVISGLLGVGSGGVLIPVLHSMRFRSHQIAMVTALAVPFSSFTGFLAYTVIESISLSTIIVASLAALLGGIIGTRLMHRIDKQLIRKLLALTLLISGGRLLWSLIA